MSNTVNADKCDVRYFAEAYESLMRLYLTESAFHMGSHGSRNVLNAYLRLSEKLGIKLFNDQTLERIESLIDADERNRKAVALRIFGSQRETVKA